jgi:glycosyltransferase involved in cell wall biosynthesis
MNIKVIFYQHSSSFDWLYDNYTTFKSIYKAFHNSKYIISIVPFDSDYLFNKWGINSILMNNFMTFDYNHIIISDLSTKNILLIGRGDAKKKRFYIGIEAMEYIIKEIPTCELNILSSLARIDKIKILVNNLGLNNNIKFNGYSSLVEIYFRNASLNIIPSISEAFPMVLSETKIYGIPSILIGLDYICISEGGNIIIYNDLPESLAVESIKIISSKEFRKNLGKEARNSMKHFNNEILLKKWVKLILSIYKSENDYLKLREEYKIISQDNGMNILNNQIQLLKLRYKAFRDITPSQYENFTYMGNYHIE